MTALRGIDGLDADAIVGRIDDEDVRRRLRGRPRAGPHRRGRPDRRAGQGRPDRRAVRYTAPSLIFRRGETALEAGGFQPIEAYDVLLANLDPTLARRPAPESPLEALEAEPQGLVTAEIAEIMRRGNAPADRGGAEDALIALAAAGDAVRVGLGDDALWLAGRYAEGRGSRAPAPSRRSTAWRSAS